MPSSLTLLIGIAAAIQPPQADDPATDVSIDELLAESTLQVERDELREQGDVVHWILCDALRDGFAETAAPRTIVGRIAAQPLFLRAAPPWPSRVAERALRLARSRVREASPTSTPRGISYDIPMADHPLVDAYIEYFTGRGRWFFRKWLIRSERFIPMMRPILAEYGLPLDLVYLAMIESGFSSQATSVARAAGYWQFIRSTGRLYGLEQSTWVDERRDFVRSTHAAASYLKHLYERFGDWHLAWAGYNAGGGRVSRALERHNETDFWGLIEHRRSLARETQHYVPKIIAAAIVAKNRERYGFDDISPLLPLTYDEVPVEDATDLRMVANKMGVPLEQLRELNPSLLHDVTPPGRRTTIRVSRGHGEQVSQLLSGMPRSKRLSYRHHRVCRGDTLYSIARRYGTTVAAIREFNGIRNPRHLRPGNRLVVPSKKIRRRVAPRRTRRRGSARSKVASPQRKPSARHIVSRGETLWSIAQRYGVTVARLKRWNHRRDDTIGIGEVLHIF